MYLKNSKIIVVKIGSSLLVDQNKKIRKQWLSSFAKDIKKLRDTNQTITDRDGNTRPANFWDFMNAEFTVSDLKKFFNAEGFTTTDGQAKKAGKRYKKGDIIPKNKKVGDLITKADIGLTGELAGSTVYGSFLLGPKIGQGFFQNLMGNFKPITMDM